MLRKMKSFILFFCFAIPYFFPVSTWAYPAEKQAVPEMVSLTVDGIQRNLLSYVIDEYHFFKVRDLAVVLSGTRHQFRPEQKSGTYIKNGVYLYQTFGEHEKYQPIGTELQTNAEAAKTAYTQLVYTCIDTIMYEPAPYSGKVSQKLEAYSIEDYSYIKLRDLATIYDFSLLWNEEKREIVINTEASYHSLDYPQPEAVAEGTVLGKAYESKQMVFINEMPILSYNLETKKEGRLSDELIYIAAEDLEQYGFDVSWFPSERILSLSYRENKPFGMLDGETANGQRTQDMAYTLYADSLKVFIGAKEISGAYSANGKILIPISELYPYGIFSDFLEPEQSKNLIQNRINIDFLKLELKRKFESMPREAIKKQEINLHFSDGGRYQEQFEKLKLSSAGGNGTVYFYSENEQMNDIAAYEIRGLPSQNSWDSLYYKFIGFYKNDRINGQGIYLKRFFEGWGMTTPSEKNQFERGIFRDGELYDGILYRSGGMKGFVSDGKRVEGAMQNGYQRISTVECDPATNTRFGYRILREGEVQNGEFCGYYREYGENGELIFEGQYSDFLSGQQN